MLEGSRDATRGEDGVDQQQEEGGNRVEDSSILEKTGE
jgi:hypothetical protein